MSDQQRGRDTMIAARRYIDDDAAKYVRDGVSAQHIDAVLRHAFAAGAEHGREQGIAHGRADGLREAAALARVRSAQTVARGLHPTTAVQLDRLRDWFESPE